MSKPAPIVLALALCITALVDAKAADVTKTISEQNGLSCKIEIAESARPHNGQLDAKLILRNTSGNPVRVCTLCMGWRSVWKGSFDVRLDPEHWISDTPSLELSAKEVATIRPGDSTAIPFEIFWQNDTNLQVTASYTVGREFAQKLGVWHGIVKAEPVTLTPRK